MLVVHELLSATMVVQTEAFTQEVRSVQLTIHRQTTGKQPFLFSLTDNLKTFLKVFKSRHR